MLAPSRGRLVFRGVGCGAGNASPFSRHGSTLVTLVTVREGATPARTRRRRPSSGAARGGPARAAQLAVAGAVVGERHRLRGLRLRGQALRHDVTGSGALRVQRRRASPRGRPPGLPDAPRRNRRALRHRPTGPRPGLVTPAPSARRQARRPGESPSTPGGRGGAPGANGRPGGTSVPSALPARPVGRFRRPWAAPEARRVVFGRAPRWSSRSIGDRGGPPLSGRRV
jgi:hypothetical protein